MHIIIGRSAPTAEADRGLPAAPSPASELRLAVPGSCEPPRVRGGANSAGAWFEEMDDRRIREAAAVAPPGAPSARPIWIDSRRARPAAVAGTAAKEADPEADGDWSNVLEDSDSPAAWSAMALGRN